jgi:dipeptidyl aminopeptidase/acylaminoacyl peptidase
MRRNKAIHSEGLMQPEDIRKIRTPGSVSLSPDARRVAFAVTRIDGAGYRSEIFVAATDGSTTPTRLTDDAGNSAPRFSPDGTVIAFLRLDAQGRRQLCLMPATGGPVRQLTDHPLGIGSPVTARHARAASAPVWSPDGARIAYTARVPNAQARAAVPAQRSTRLRYRTDGSGYTVNTPSHVFVTDVASGKATQLTDGDCEHWDVSWHSGGAHLLAATARHDTRDLDEAQDIIAVSLAGDVRQLTPTSTTVNLPTSSPDGATVYFVGIGDLGEGLNDARGRNVSLFRIPFAGGAPTRITDTETIDLDDGRTRPLAVSAHDVLGATLDRGAVRLVSIAPNGTARDLIGGQRCVTDYDRAGDVVAACVTDATSAGDVIVLRDGVETTLTTLGAEIAGAGLRPMVEITATAPDGYPVHGWLMTPPGPGPHPVLLLIHGGPDWQFQYQLFDEAQVYASRYAVILANPRGSAGYGEAHARSIRERLGTVDADDLMALFDAVTARPDIDGSRAGVLGGSYGGFMTAWLAAHHGDRFRAAIGERGVYAWDSLFGTSDIGYAMTSMVGTDPAKWPAQAPLTHADKIRIPILIVHWEGDLRVPFEQAQRMFTALRARRAPAELLVFPGGDHGVSRSGPPDHRLTRFEAILEWFARHLA